MQRRTLLRLTTTAGASLLLGGCSFHLRGLDQSLLPFSSLALASPKGPFRDLVTRRLELAGTRVDAGARIRINLGAESFNERRLSVLQSGRQEHEMRLRVPLSVQRDDGAYLIDQQSLEARERFSLDSDNLLGGGDRREAVRTRLRQKAARQLLDRLRALDA